MHLRMHPDVVVVERPDGTSWLLHMSANTLRLDLDSTQLLQSILARGADSSARELARHFDVDEEEVRRDVAAFVRDLQRQRVLVSGAQPQRTGLADRVIDASLAFADRPSRAPRRRAWWLLLAARLSVALFGWAATIHAWERRYPQPSEPREDGDALDAIDHAVRDTAARSLLHHECKERGLACLAMARRAGVAADLLIGLTYTPLAAHVWVECGDRIISDLPEHCTPYERVMRYGGNGAA
ncbi:MAG: lasso peptide biosynthesis B2 protein [Thermoanaerobaculia bacterium]